jgi:hypothetical protein
LKRRLLRFGFLSAFSVPRSKDPRPSDARSPTKSTLIERDIALLQRIAERNTLTLHLTITTPIAALARLLQPRAPRPDLRLRTVG